MICSAILFPSYARSSRTSMPVDLSPDFVFLGGFNFRKSNKISDNCLGDPILNSLPANLKIFFSTFLILSSNSLDKFFR